MKGKKLGEQKTKKQQEITKIVFAKEFFQKLLFISFVYN